MVPSYLLLLPYFLNLYFQHGCYHISACEFYKNKNQVIQSALLTACSLA